MTAIDRLVSMGAYTGYVWSAYLVTGLVLVLVAWFSHRKFQREKAVALRRRDLQ